MALKYGITAMAERLHHALPMAQEATFHHRLSPHVPKMKLSVITFSTLKTEGYSSIAPREDVIPMHHFSRKDDITSLQYRSNP